MVGIISSSGLGLFDSSADRLGSPHGNPTSLGQAKGSAYVNIATGNLSVQFLDESLSGTGADLSALRTYNSQGGYVDGDADGWRWNGEKKVVLAGTANTTSAVVTRTTGDGTETTFKWDGVANSNRYVSTAGSGAHDVIYWDENANEWVYKQDSSGDLIERYDGSTGWINSLRDNSNNGFDYTFDGNLLTKIWDLNSGQTIEFTYTNNKLSQVSTRTTTTGTLTKQVYYSYNSSGFLETVRTDLTPSDDSIADDNVYTTKYSYDTSGRLSQITQYEGIVEANFVQTKFTYYDDEQNLNRIKTVEDQTGITTFTYASLSTSVQNGNNQTWTYTYDALGQLVSHSSATINGALQKASYSYDPQGNVKTITDGRDKTITYDYDTSGNSIKEYDSLGNTITRTFDGNNHVLTETKYSVASTTSPGGAETTRYVYDTEGRVRFVISPEGRVSEMRYNSSFNSWGMVSHTVQYTTAKYTASSVLLADVEAWANTNNTNAQITEFQYDYRGNLSKKTEFASVNSSGAGVVDSAATITEYTYSEHGQLLQTIAVRGANRDQRTTLNSYAYDGMGRQITAINDNVTTTTTYYSLNITVTNTATGLTTISTTDASGRLVNLTQSGSGTNRITKYYYDNAGQLRMTEDPTGARSYLFYDHAGRVNAKVDAAGAATVYTRDNDGRVLTEIRYANLISNATLTSWSITPPLTFTSPTADSTNDRKTTYTYDEAGRLKTTTVDGLATVTNFYDGASRLIRTEQGDRITRYFYDKDGRKVGELDAVKYLKEFVYDSAGRLIMINRYGGNAYWGSDFTLDAIRNSVKSGGRLTTYYFYDAQGRQSGIVNEQGFLTEIVYDEVNNRRQETLYKTPVSVAESSTFEITESLTAVKGRAGSTNSTTTQYDLYGRIETVTTQDGTINKNIHDSAGRLIRQIQAEGSSDERATRTRYNAFNEVTGIVNGVGDATLSTTPTTAQIDTAITDYGTRYDIDGAGRKIAEYGANGQKTFLFYNAAGQLTFTMNALGEVGQNIYNAFGQISETRIYTNRLSSTDIALFTTGGRDNVISTKVTADNQNDKVDKNTYTKFGSVFNQTDAEGFRVSNSYTSFGDLSYQTKSITQPSSVESQWYFYYNNLGNVINRTNDSAMSYTFQSAYDGYGRLFSSGLNESPNSYQHLLIYSDKGRIIQKIDALGRQTKTETDYLGRLVKAHDALGNLTTYVYDDTERKFTVIHSDGSQIVTWKTRTGEILKAQDANGNITHYTYDKNGKIKTAINGQSNKVSDNTYDQSGRLYESIDANGTKTLYSYDSANRVVQKTVDPNGLNLRTYYEFDGQGRQLNVTSGYGSEEASVTKYVYDRKGQIRQIIVDPDGLQLSTSFTYDGLGQTIQIEKGTISNPSQQITKYTYDKHGNKIKEQIDPNGLSITTHYQYDLRGNLVKKTDANGQSTHYAYDKENQLRYVVDAEGAVTENIYDLNGNLSKSVIYSNKITQVLNVGSSDNNTISVIANTGGWLELTGNRVNVDTNKIYKVRVRMRQLNNSGAVSLGVKTYSSTNAELRNTNINSDTYAYPGGTKIVSSSDGWVTIEGDITGTNPISTTSSPNKFFEGSVKASVFLRVDATNQEKLVEVDSIEIIDTETGAVLNNFSQMEKEYFNGYSITNGKLAGTHNFRIDAYTVEELSSLITPDLNNDRLTNFSYDKLNRLRYTVNAVGVVSENVYDANGNVTRTTQFNSIPSLAGNYSLSNIESKVNRNDLLNRDTNFIYDKANRLRFTINAEGAISEIVYDANGNVISTTKFNKPLPDVSLQINSDGVNGSQTITDQSVRPKTITASGDAKISTADFKSGTSSLYFDGNGDFLTASSSQDFNIGNGDFTLEFWIKPTTVTGNSGLLFLGDIASNQNRIQLDMVNGYLNLYGQTNVADVWSNRATSNPLVVNKWSHIAVSRSGNTFKIFLDGVQVINTTYTANITTNNTLRIGTARIGGSQVYFKGYMDDIRITKGTGRYNNAFTPSILKDNYSSSNIEASIDRADTANRTTNFVYDSANRLRYTVNAERAVTENIYDAIGNVISTKTFNKPLPDVGLHINADGENGSQTITDQSVRTKTITASGDAKISTTDYKSGTSSLYFDGSGDFLTAAPSQDFDIGNSDFTLELWVKPTTVTGKSGLLFLGDITSNQNRIQLDATDGYLNLYAQSSTSSFVWGAQSTTNPLIANKWSHIAISRSGSTFKIFLDGVEVISTVHTANVDTNNTLRIGTARIGGSQVYFKGYMDDIRITKGTGHYSNNFIPSILKNNYSLLNIEASIDHADTENRTTSYIYDKANRLRFTVNAEGYVSENTYDSFGNVKTVTQFNGPLANQANYSEDTINGAVNHSDAANRTTTYIYDKANRVRFTVNAEGYVTENTYDAFGNVKTVTQFNSALTNPIDESTINIEVNRLDPANRTNIYDYDKANRQTKTTLSGWYDVSMGKVYGSATESDADPLFTNDLKDDRFQRTIEVTYDAFGNAVANKIRVGNSNDISQDFIYQYKTYDKLNREVHDIDGLGYVTRKTYYPTGELKTVMRAANPITVKTSGYWLGSDVDMLINNSATRVIEYQYDKVGRQTQVIQPYTSNNFYGGQTWSAASVTVNSYNSFGDLIRQSQFIGTNTADTYFYYDKLGRQVWNVNAEGYGTQTGYNSFGDVLQTTEFSNRVTGYTSGIPTYTSNFYDRVTTNTYDKLGQVKTTNKDFIDVANVKTNKQITSIDYNAFGEVRNNFSLSSETGLLTNKTSMEYNKLGQVTKVTEPERVVAGTDSDVFKNISMGGINLGSPITATPTTIIAYNAFGERLSETRNGISIEHQYDLAGNEIATKDGVGNWSYAGFDAGGKVIRQWQAVSVTSATSQTNYNYTIDRRFEYDKAGRQIATVDIFDNGTKLSGQLNNYNGYGEVTEERKIWGTYTDDAKAGIDTSSYKGDANLNALINRYEYDANGRVSLKQSGDGYTYYYYDRVGRVTRTVQQETATSNSATDRVTTLTLDKLGRATTQVLPGLLVNTGFGTTAVGSAPSSPTITRSYDRWGNVLGESGATLTKNYTYNQDNQVLSEEGNYEFMITYAGATPTTKLRKEFYYNANNQLTSEIQKSILVAGGEVSRTAITNTYNSVGQLTQTKDATNVTQSFIYDANGNRVGTKDALGHVWVDTFNANGQITEHGLLRVNGAEYTGTQTGTFSKVSSFYHYDQAGRKHAEGDAFSNYDYYKLDERNSIVASRDKIGIHKIYEYDYLGNKTKELQRYVATSMYDPDGPYGAAAPYPVYTNTDKLMNTWSYLDQANVNAGDFLDYKTDKLQWRQVGSDLTLQYRYDYTKMGQLEREWRTDNSAQTGYEYYGNGLQKKITDVRNIGVVTYTKTSEMGYDLRGNKTFEVNRSIEDIAAYQELYTEDWNDDGTPEVEYWVDVEASQRDTGSMAQYFAYDSLDRLTRLQSPVNSLNLGTSSPNVSTYSIDVNYAYDEWGNRRLITGAGKTEWYSYDAADRVLIEAGDSDGTQAYVFVEGGKKYGYDSAGRRRSEESYATTRTTGNPDYYPIDEEYSVRTYYYNDLNLVSKVELTYNYRDVGENSTGSILSSTATPFIAETNLYDDRGFKTYTKGLTVDHTTFTYKLNGALATQTTTKTSTNETKSVVTYNYNTLGQMTQYKVDNYNSAGTSVSNWTKYVYEYMDTYTGEQIRKITASSSQGGTAPGSTSNSYNHKGQLTFVSSTEMKVNSNTQTGTGYRQFVYNNAGQILLKLQKRAGESDYKAQNYYYSPTGGELANIDQYRANISPLSAIYEGSNTPGSYTVNAGDTLMGISQTLFGDANLWYLIADANGLSQGPTDELDASLVGRNLRIPNSDQSIGNTSTNWKPYNPTEMIGDLTPTIRILPPPRKKFGFLSSLISVIVAAIVTYYTKSPALGQAAGNMAGQYSSLMLNGEFDWKRYAEHQLNPLAKFRGNRKELFTEMVDPLSAGAPGKVDYESVAISAAAGYITQGVAGSGGGFWAGVAQGATSYTANYGLNRLAGNNPTFNARGMVVQALGQGISNQIGGDPNSPALDPEYNFSLKAFNWSQMAQTSIITLGQSGVNYTLGKIIDPENTHWDGATAAGAAFGQGIMGGFRVQKPKPSRDAFGNAQATGLTEEQVAQLNATTMGIVAQNESKKAQAGAASAPTPENEAADPSIYEYGAYKASLVDRERLVTRYKYQTDYMIESNKLYSKLEFNMAQTAADMDYAVHAWDNAVKDTISHMRNSYVDGYVNAKVEHAMTAQRYAMEAEYKYAMESWDNFTNIGLHIALSPLYLVGIGGLARGAGVIGTGLMNGTKATGRFVANEAKMFAGAGAKDYVMYRAVPFGTEIVAAGIGEYSGASVVTGVVAAASYKYSDEILELGGTAVRHLTKWRTNQELGIGGTRSLAYAKDLAETYGADLGNVRINVYDDIQYEKFFPNFKNSDAHYGTFMGSRGARVTWENTMVDKDGLVNINVRASILDSDEAIVAVLNHEAYEISELRRILNGGSLSPLEYDDLVRPGPQNIHWNAVDFGDNAVREWRLDNHITSPYYR